MHGNYSYLLAVFFLAIPVILIEWVFFYQVLKNNIFPVIINIIIGLIIVSISEPLGLFLRAWEYGETTTLSTFYFGVKLESYIYVILGAIAMSSVTIISANYQDIKAKNIFLQGFKDLLSAKYAFWKTHSE